ncbi:MAG: hypothetical protein V7L31_27000 [Nostoc sp.]
MRESREVNPCDLKQSNRTSVVCDCFIPELLETLLQRLHTLRERQGRTQ